MVRLPTSVREAVAGRQNSRSHLQKFLLLLNYRFFKTLQGWSSYSSSHWSAPKFHFYDVLHHFTPRLVASFFMWPHFLGKCKCILFQMTTKVNFFSELCVPGSLWGTGSREKPCSNSVIVKLWHKQLFSCLCWVIQWVTGSQILHVNFLKESTRHVFLEELFATAYAKYYNSQAVMSFVFSFLSPLIHRRPLPLALSLITASQK